MRVTALMMMLGLASAGVAVAKPPVSSATAMLSKADGTPVGKASFTKRSGGIWMKVEAQGLNPGTHGIHLHTVGQCKGPDFASAGAHWNPMNKKHGLDSPDGAHMGDLPNLVIGADGKGKIETLIKGASFDSGHMMLLDSDGAALVIHAAPDDNRTDPSGNSGGRIACGVVTES